MGTSKSRSPLSCHDCATESPLTAAAARALASSAPILRVVQRRRAADGPAITCPCRAAVIALRFLAGLDREAFLVIHLDNKRGALSAEVIAIGTLTATLVHPREVFKGALLANAAAIVLAHNHPSGDPTPSPEDLALTVTLIAAGELLGVKVEDHLIVGDAVVSMRQTTAAWLAR